MPKPVRGWKLDESWHTNVSCFYHIVFYRDIQKYTAKGKKSKKNTWVSHFPCKLIQMEENPVVMLQLLSSNSCSSGYMIWIRNMKVACFSCLVWLYKLTLLICSLAVIIVGMFCCLKLNLSILGRGSFIPMVAPTPRTPLPSKQQPECEVYCLAHRPCNCNTAAIVS